MYNKVSKTGGDFTMIKLDYSCWKGAAVCGSQENTRSHGKGCTKSLRRKWALTKRKLVSEGTGEGASPKGYGKPESEVWSLF